MSEQLCRCNRCRKPLAGEESRIEMRVGYHWYAKSVGFHFEEHYYDLCDSCSKEFAKFISNEKKKDLSNGNQAKGL